MLRGCTGEAPGMHWGCSGDAPRCTRVTRGCTGAAPGCTGDAPGCSGGAPKSSGVHQGAPGMLRGCSEVPRGCSGLAPRSRRSRGRAQGPAGLLKVGRGCAGVAAPSYIWKSGLFLAAPDGLGRVPAPAPRRAPPRARPRCRRCRCSGDALCSRGFLPLGWVTPSCASHSASQCLGG